MIKSLKNNLDIWLINVGGLVIALLLYLSLGEKVEIIGAVLAAAISISVGVRSYRIENDKIFKELFETFNKSYDSKFNGKLNDISDDSEGIDETLIIDYLNLCAEEYLWYRKSRISEVVWTSWKAGMLFHLRKTPIRKIVEREQVQKDSYYGLFDEIQL